MSSNPFDRTPDLTEYDIESNHLLPEKASPDVASVRPPMLNVLVLAYYFPPMGLSGVQRTLKFVKYLPEFGIRPIVVTAPETPYFAHDETLLDEIQPLIDSDLIRIVRTSSSGTPAQALAAKSGKLLKLPRAAYQRIRSKIIQTFLQPDSRIRWKASALEAVDTIYREEKIDAVLATAPPYTSFLIARHLRHRYGTPYLMDYRDAWVSNPVLNFYATPFHRAYAAKLEDDCLRSSDAVTVVNRRMKEVLLSDYPFLSHEDVHILPHGFDQDDLDRALPFAGHLRDSKKFRVTYAGAFYVGRSPRTMFEAAALAMKTRPEMKSHLELLFVGLLQKEYQKLAKKLGVADIVTERGYVAHRESVGLLLASDVLWMTMSDDISSPGKLYEYFGARRPILGLVPKHSHAERLLKEYGAATTAEPNDARAVASLLISYYDAWVAGGLPSATNDAFIAGYDRRTLTQEMARRLSHIAHVT